MNKAPQNRIVWVFTTGCRLNVHGFDSPEDGERCVCGLTILRQKRGGWEAVWNTRGVGFGTTTRRPKMMRKRDWDELARLCERALMERPDFTSMMTAKKLAQAMMKRGK